MSETSFLTRLKGALGLSSSKLGGGLASIFPGPRKLDDGALEKLEELLIQADIGLATASRLVTDLSRESFDRQVDADDIRAALAGLISSTLSKVAVPLRIDPAHAPHVLLVVGVNGSGKTTTIGKLAAQQKAAGRSVMLAAGDTFRAAAVEQLKIWGDRIDCPVFARETGADAAGLAFDAVAAARRDGVEVLFIDTAGRLQNRSELMEELRKVQRVIGKRHVGAPHDTILVLDATVGQNAHSQVSAFQSMMEISGLVLTKLDGSARGGVLVSLAERHGLPVHAVGIGERAEDLRPFDVCGFARSLVGLD